MTILNLLIATLWILNITFGKTVLADYALSDNLATHLNQDARINQLLFLYEGDFHNDAIHQLGKNISRFMPTRIVDFKNIIKGNHHKLKLPPYVLEITKIVLIAPKNDYRNFTKVLNILESVESMSQPKMLPKVLIAIQVTKSRKYREFLQLLWLKQFLDVSILELNLENGETTLTETLHSEDAKLHYYNPFTKKFIKMTFSKNSNLFPDKLRDLNGFKMKAGIFHYPPYVYINRNSTEHVLNFYGPDFNLLMQLSNAVNFSVEKIISPVSNWPEINCTKEYNVGRLRKIIYNEIQFVAVQTSLYNSCSHGFIAISSGTRIINQVILVPILSSETQELTVEWNLYNVIIIFILFLVPWLIARILSFDRRYWKLINTIQVVLGSFTPKVPRKFTERVVLITMVVYYFLQSSYIYTTFSNLQLIQKQTTQEMETLEDLVAANLTFVLHVNFRTAGENDDKDAYQKLMKNAFFSEGSLEECVRTLIHYRNVSCMGREHMALIMIKKYGNTQSSSRMKILKEIAGFQQTGMYLAGGSPYKSRFEKITCTLVESGISEKWDATYIPRAELPQNKLEQFKQENTLPTKGFNLMIILLVVGHLC